ncbi:hypothetical protein JOQ06_008120 [Pogonophryne albipinna]|uniref:peptidylglycine monooxygenase n=1 Tax=Pogonophryne albipinna TaxID=1090488 RepID=A0AAD6F9R9_9TELE|nr:hypothetical protein JOQ06_008120 [Pogonophryne albipinna]
MMKTQAHGEDRMKTQAHDEDMMKTQAHGEDRMKTQAHDEDSGSWLMMKTQAHGEDMMKTQAHGEDRMKAQAHGEDRMKAHETNADMACDYSSYPIYPFAFRTHTHHLGKVVSGYRIRGGKWSLIGRQSPQLPQAFYPANKDVSVKYGDTIAGRCVFTGEGRTSKTYIGGTSADEMCNFYIMYYMDSRHAVPYMTCMEPGSKELFQHIPDEANMPIAVSPADINSMMHMRHSTDHQDNRLLWNDNKEALDQGHVSAVYASIPYL